MMLAAGCHLGTKNCDFQMERYVWKRRSDGIYIINLGKTWDKLMLAARILVAIENPADVVCQSARPYGQRAVLKYAQYTGAKAIAGRHTPGTYTNQISGGFPRAARARAHGSAHGSAADLGDGVREPPHDRLLRHGLPLKLVDVAIPANNKAKHSIGCLYYLLARMVLQMRGTISPANPWDVMVDLFFYREPEELEDKPEEPAAAVVGDAPAYDANAFGAPPGPGGAEPWDEQAGGAAGGFGGAVPVAGQWNEAPAPAGWDAAAAPVDASGFGSGFDVAPGGY